MTEECKSCRFVRWHGGNMYFEGKWRCHRRAPDSGYFIAVEKTDWCGEYQAVRIEEAA